MEKFIDREEELNTLESEYRREGASLVILYGRRRVGKTSLISEFIKDKNIPFILIATKTDKLNQSEKAKMMKNVKEVFGEIDFIKASVDDAKSIEKIRETIVSLVLK